MISAGMPAATLSASALDDLADALSGRPTDLYSERRAHDGCGECCSRFLPLSMQERAVMENLARVPGNVTPERPGTLDLRCPFLDRRRRCRIYDLRPAVCRAYSCADHAAGDLRAAAVAMPLSGTYETTDVRELVRAAQTDADGADGITHARAYSVRQTRPQTLSGASEGHTGGAES